MHFSAVDAIPMGAAMVLQTALLRFIFFSSSAKHPEKPYSTEIDYNMVKIVQPLFLLGSYFGVLVYIALGEMILVVLLIAVLTPIGLQSLCKGRSMYAKESEKIYET